MTETQIVLTIKHTKPLPESATDEISSRFYGWAHSKGVPCDVEASVVDLKRLRVITGLPSHVERCIGHGVGPSGHQLRADCENCQRRTAPRAGYELIDPPTDFPCPSRIPA